MTRSGLWEDLCLHVTLYLEFFFSAEAIYMVEPVQVVVHSSWNGTNLVFTGRLYFLNSGDMF